MAKIHQIQFWPGLRPRPHWGAYEAPLDPGHPLKVGPYLCRSRHENKSAMATVV